MSSDEQLERNAMMGGLIFLSALGLTLMLLISCSKPASDTTVFQQILPSKDFTSSK